MLDPSRSVRRAEVRALTNTSAEAIPPPDLSTFLWEALPPMSVLLASYSGLVNRLRKTWTARG